jgi:mannose/fructose/N-acetylgalactosamine-specific phosphotransferase system component IIC
MAGMGNNSNLACNLPFQKKTMKTPYTKFLYIGFLILGFYQAIFSKDYMQAAASLGIGMAFDPFNPDQKWNERPNWQKAVLIIHLALVAAMFGFGIGLNDK